MRIQQLIYLCFTFILSAEVSSVDESNRISGIEGEYRGTVKRTEMTLWAAMIAGPDEEKALALMFFPTARQQAQVDRLGRLTDNLLTAGSSRCDLENILEQVYRPGPAARNGLVLIHGDWEHQPDLKISRHPEGYWMMNDEYLFLRGREYMVKEIKSGSKSGELTSLQLTQTGFIQNFFDNPSLRLARIEAVSTGPELLANYVKAKFAARNALNKAFENLPQESVTPCP